MESPVDRLSLNFGFSFEDLYAREGLVRLDQTFLAHLRDHDAALHDRLVTARFNPSDLACKDQSESIIELAPHLETFIGEVFDIAWEVKDLQARHDRLAPLYTVKRNFVQRKAVPRFPAEKAAAIDGAAIRADVEAFATPLTERYSRTTWRAG